MDGTNLDVEAVVVKEYVDEFGNPVVEYNSGKTKKPIRISKTIDGFMFFKAEVIGAATQPKALATRFSGIRQARRTVEDYIKNAKVSPTVRRDQNTKDREERKLAKSNATSD